MINCFKSYDYLNTVTFVSISMFYIKHVFKANVSTHCTYPRKKNLAYGNKNK